MEVQNPRVDGFSAYGNDQAMLPPQLDTEDSFVAWEDFDDWPPEDSYEWLNKWVPPNNDDAVLYQVPPPQNLADDNSDTALMGVALDTSLSSSIHQIEPVDNFKETPPSRHRLSRDQTAALDAWLSGNLSYPYPTEHEKMELAAKTGLSRKRIEHWFSRTRQRKLPKPISSPPSMQYSVARSAQQSLEVLPAQSAHSLPSLAGELSESDSQVDSESGSLPERQFEGFPGSMLSWWLDTPEHDCNNFEKDRKQETRPGRASIHVWKRLKSVAAELPGYFDIDINDSTDRAFLRLVKLLRVGETKNYHTNLFLLRTVFRFTEHPGALLVYNVLNEIDSMPSIPLAVCQLVSNLKDLINGDIGDFSKPGRPIALTTLLVIFSTCIEDLSSELSRLHFVLPSEFETLGLDSLTTKRSDDSFRLTAIDKLGPIIFGEPDDMNFSIEVDASQHSQDNQSVTSSSTVKSSLSACSYTSFGSRRGRRRPALTGATAVVEPAAGNELLPYQCTFCPKRFSRKYTWQRHEESVHVPQKVYICSSEHLKPQSTSDRFGCPWCPSLGDRLFLRSDCDHRGGQCWTRPIDERTFFRRDNLVQHFSLVHKAAPRSFAVLNASKCQKDTRPTMEQLECPLCGYRSTTWKERVAHVVKHFEQKATTRF